MITSTAQIRCNMHHCDDQTQASIELGETKTVYWFFGTEKNHKINIFCHNLECLDRWQRSCSDNELVSPGLLRRMLLLLLLSFSRGAQLYALGYQYEAPYDLQPLTPVQTIVPGVTKEKRAFASFRMRPKITHGGLAFYVRELFSLISFDDFF